MNKKAVWLAVSMFAGAILVSGCANNATDAELQQLKDLRAQIAQLESQNSAKESQKSDLQKQLADRDDKLKQCQSDQEEYKKATGK